MKLFFRCILVIFPALVLVSFVNAGKIWLEPSQGSLIAGCSSEIAIMIDTQGVETNTVGIAFYADDTSFSLGELGTIGGIFSGYTNFTTTQARYGERKSQQIISFMGTTAQQKGFIGSGVLAKLKVIPLSGARSLDIAFYMISGTLADDSNINYLSGERIFDALTDVVGGTYTVVDGMCAVDESAILISEKDPVILRTQDKEFFFFHQMPWFKQLLKIMSDNILYIVAGLLAISLIVFLLMRKIKKSA